MKLLPKLVGRTVIGASALAASATAIAQGNPAANVGWSTGAIVATVVVIAVIAALIVTTVNTNDDNYNG
ncbi:hypothetical protein [Legionella impletisoli]|uniref:Uncharacterized protein n=1 Tax=Legionella impletisoli TaxID=343510 RepID=A0A917JM83_9GAMM|nr:hypothetical protein [Legionella impletisoli]GGI77228.1 hypothetical protein GCM10007966_02420 [Legionella impletisoli]